MSAPTTLDNQGEILPGFRQPRPLAQSMRLGEEGGPKFTVRGAVVAAVATVALAAWVGFIPVSSV
ncbi:MAG: hypothetical protein HN377_10310, partial [Alphaproteobacteria bacterium]|nr:hypothetical protein [Alphaproteobacteria bacterium]